MVCRFCGHTNNPGVGGSMAGAKTLLLNLPLPLRIVPQYTSCANRRSHTVLDALAGQARNNRRADIASIAVVDDDEEFLQLAGDVLGKAGMSLHVHGSCATVGARAGQFDCIICNVNSRQAAGFELLKRRGAEIDICPVILISAHNEVDLALQAGKLGAVDFLVKPVERKRLLGAVRAALREGERQRAEAAQVADLFERYMSLTERQRQTMNLLLQGKTNKEVADALSISARTVEVYRAWVMTKMDAPSLVHLVRIGIRLGIG
jgi:FixJ family two-component response regulator